MKKEMKTERKTAKRAVFPLTELNEGNWCGCSNFLFLCVGQITSTAKRSFCVAIPGVLAEHTPYKLWHQNKLGA
jgi:hypothetical protein